MARKALGLTGLLALAASIAACGTTHVVGAHRTVYVALTEYRLAPQQVQADAGRLTIFVLNDGRYTHNLAVIRGGHTTGATQPIAPGHRARLTVTVRNGNYVIASTMLEDQDLGLYGSLVVK